MGDLPGPDETMVTLAALAIQCMKLLFYMKQMAVLRTDYTLLQLLTELGDFQPGTHDQATISEFRFFPDQSQHHEALIFDRYKTFT